MTVKDVELIRARFSENMSVGVVTGIDVFQEQAGDVVSLLGANGLPILGFTKNRAGFYLVDARGDCVDVATSLEGLLSAAEKLVAHPVEVGTRHLHRWFLFEN